MKIEAPTFHKDMQALTEIADKRRYWPDAVMGRGGGHVQAMSGRGGGGDVHECACVSWHDLHSHVDTCCYE